MIKLNRIFLIVCFCIVSFAHAEGVLRFATDTFYPPFGSRDENNHFIGFDIDLAHAICDLLNKKCELLEIDYDEQLENLGTGEYEAVIAARDITFDAQDWVFSKPYHRSQGRFVAWKGKYTLPLQLRGKRIGAEIGTVYYDYLKKSFRSSEVVPYEYYDDAMIDLVAGKIDAFFSDTDLLYAYMKRDEEIANITQRTPNFTLFGKSLNDQDYGSHGLGIAIHENDQTLLEQINRALGALEQNGTLQRLKDKWLAPADF